MANINIHEFKWVELVNDSKGRTSPTKFIGVIGCLTALSCFGLSGGSLIAVLWFTNKSQTDFSQVLGAFQNLMMNSVALFTLSSAMLGINRLSSDRTAIGDKSNDEPK